MKYSEGLVTLMLGDCIKSMKGMPDQSVNCCVTSPPYFGLRDYGCDGQIGLEDTPDAFVARLVEVFREVRRVLRDDGTLWLNLGDSYASQGGDHAKHNSNQKNVGACRCHANGSADKGTRRPTVGLKPKDLIGIPWRVAFALQADGWYLRQDIIWHKPNPMPESVKDRCCKAHEYIFLLSKSARYYYDADAIKEPVADSQIGRVRDDVVGRNKGDVTHHSPGGHYTKGREPACYHGSKFNTGKTVIHQLSRSSDSPRVTGNFPGRDDGGRACNKPGQEKRTKRSVWTVTTKPYKGAHFATFPPDLIEPCILAGCPKGGVVLDPFNGAGTTGVVSAKHRRQYIGIELNPEYFELSKNRIKKATSQQELF